MHWTVSANEQAQLTSILYSLEKQSAHPLAEAVTAFLPTRELLPLDAFDSITGRGVRAAHQNIVYYAGNESLLNENYITLPADLGLYAAGLQNQAKTLIYFARQNGSGGQVLAVIAIADPVKASSKQAIETLQSRGIDVYMLTGDNEQTAAAVAGQVGIRHYKAGVMPGDKADFVKALQVSGKVVAMVGDGINDSQALAQADVSIAMGKGSDIAIDVARMTLITSDLTSIPRALNLSKQTVRVVRQNLFWAFIYNLIGIPLAAGVLFPAFGFLLNPMIAGAAMALSSVSVVSNSLRLRGMKL